MNRSYLLGSVALGLFLTYGTSQPVKAQTESTTSSSGYTFKCIPSQNKKKVFQTITIDPDGKKIKNPLFIWKSQEFNPKGYTPERRCQAVTDRLNAAVAKVGGNPNKLKWTMGMINNLRVICNVNDTNLGCDSSNILITLTKGNRTGTSLLMAAMIKFSASGTQTAITD